MSAFNYFEYMDELNEQGDALNRMKTLSELSDQDKKWLKKASRLAGMYSQPESDRYDRGARGVQDALEADFVLSKASNYRNKRLFYKQLGLNAKSWVQKSLRYGNDAFVGDDKKLVYDDKGPGPVVAAKSFALALDDELFNSINPNILTLAALNLEQKWRRIWPDALTTKVQYALEKRLAQQFIAVKKEQNEQSAIDYIQQKWLSPIINQDSYREADSIKVKTICAAAEQADISLIGSYMWEVESKVIRSGDIAMQMMLRCQIERHENLRQKQKHNVFRWILNRFGERNSR